MSSKKINLHGIGPRLIIWTTLLLIVSLLSVSATIYYLLSDSLRQTDKDFIYRLRISYARTLREEGIEKLKDSVSPDLYVAVVNENGQELVEILPEFIDHDFEDEKEIEQMRVGVRKLELRQGWSTILFTSGEEEKDFYHKFEHRLRLFVWERGWESILPIIDNDMVDVFVAPLEDGKWIKIGKSFEDREENLERVRNITYVLFIPFVLVSLFLSFLLARSILAPIKSLVTVISGIKKGNRSLRGEVRNFGDEVDLLTIEFNSLLDRNDALITNIKSTVDNVAHDLRTPITRFRISAENALTNNNEVNRLKEALQDGLENSEQILSLLNAIMDVSEAESETMIVKRKKLDLRNLVSELMDLFQYAAEEKSIDIKCTIPENICIEGDEVRLLQAFSNILDNAIKYSRPNGKVQIEAIVNQETVTLNFKDNGQGIEEKDLERIWDRLYRGDESRSTSGLGIGLSIVRAIVKVHHGEVKVSSKPGEGSLFSIVLPLCNVPVSLK
jgi:signal transduction histidine kinase